MTCQIISNKPDVYKELSELGQYFQSYFDTSEEMDEQGIEAGNETVTSAADNIRYAVWYYFHSEELTVSLLTYKQVMLAAVWYFSLYHDNELPRFVSLVIAALSDWLQADDLPATNFYDPFKGDKNEHI
jgi:hypothetical protein